MKLRKQKRHPTISGRCRLCLDSFAECFTTIDNPQLKNQMEKVFCFPIVPKEGYHSGVCQNCSYAISEFYQYSEKVRQNQEVLNGNVTNCDGAVDSRITIESVKIETLSDSGLPKRTEDACESNAEDSDEEGFTNSDDDKSYEPPPKKSQTKRKGRSRDKSSQNSKQITRGTQQEQNEQDQLFNQHFRMICDLCGTSATTFTLLRTHFRKEHKIRDGYVVCCNKKLFKRYIIQDHIDFHANPNVFRCDKCYNTYSCRKSLSIHMTNQHSGKNRTLVCDTCGKKFLSKSCFDRHMNEHIGIEGQRIQCKICQRWLKSKQILRIHMNCSHTDGSREFQCDICLQKYPHSRALYKHKYRMHAKPKHKCDVCGEKFKKAIYLKKHHTTHAG